MPSLLRILSLPLALTATIALAACGGSDDPSSPPPSTPAAESPAPSAPSAPSASSGTSNEQDTARVQLTQCLREQGLDVPDAQAPGDLFRTLSPADRQKVQDALEGPCSEFQTRAFGDTTGGHDEDFLDDLTAFTGCLRKNGFDVPDPDPSNPFSVLHSLDQSDPKVAKASAACQDELAALQGGG